jgi:hypothetical protein
MNMALASSIAIALACCAQGVSAQSVDGRQLLDLLRSADQRVQLAGQTYILGVIDAVSWESGNTAADRIDYCFAPTGRETAVTLSEVVRQFLTSLEKQGQLAFLDGFPANGLVRGALAEKYPCNRPHPQQDPDGSAVS